MADPTYDVFISYSSKDADWVRGSLLQGLEDAGLRVYIDFRDFETGFTAMNRTVGYTASIGAQMIGAGQITKHGLLSPATDVPYENFVLELNKRGISVTLETMPAEQLAAK